MTDGSGRWEEVQTLAVGDHVHLHELIDGPPPPGSRDWLPILEQLVTYLVELGGHWVVTLPIGKALLVPTDVRLTADNVFDYVDTIEPAEPPAVHRLCERAILNMWAGEQHTWTGVPAPDVLEKVNFGRAQDERADEGFDISVSFEIRR